MNVAGFHPGLLSGIVLAGGNRPPRPEGDDGILTAEEVSLLNLSGCRMCVLSACETGLGQVAGGEGLLGLQAPFKWPGAHHDHQPVESRRYGHAQPDGTVLQEPLAARAAGWRSALHEAQIWILRDQSNRGLAILEQPADDDDYLGAYYWAAFVLSGDWR